MVSWKRHLISCLCAIFLVGIASGGAAVLIVYLLRWVQHHAFNYSLNQLISDQRFIDGVRAASPWRRFSVLLLCGGLAGTGWFALSRWGKPLMSIEKVLQLQSPQMPFWSMVAHIILQITTIGLGSPLGREVAPREAGALLAIHIGNAFKLESHEIKELLACGAGAGLGAVYNIPLSGVLFTLEVLLRTIRLRVACIALLTSTVATYIARVSLGHEVQFPLIASLPLQWEGWLGVIGLGAVCGLTGHLFSYAITFAKDHAARDVLRVPYCLLNFTFIGLLSIYFPELLGNGKGLVYMGVYESISAAFVVFLFLGHSLVVWTTFRAGAYGGLLMPSLANGVLIGVGFEYIFNGVSPVSSSQVMTIMGGAAFLAVTQHMPFTAVAIAMELTGLTLDWVVPIAVAVMVAVGVSNMMGRWKGKSFKVSNQRS